MSALQRTSTSETLSPTLRGPIYQNAVCPSLDNEIKDIQSQIKPLEDLEEKLAQLYGKDKNTLDSEEVRTTARCRAFETKDPHDCHDLDEMEKLHRLRLRLSERLNAQNTRSRTVNEHHNE